MKGEDAAIRAKIHEILARHIGKEKAIGMGELFERVFDRPWKHRINDTKPLREYIEVMRNKGIPIGRSTSKTNPGYYLPRSAFEFNEIVRKYDRKGLGAFKKSAAMRKISLPEFLGQLQIGLTTGRRDGLSRES